MTIDEAIAFAESELKAAYERAEKIGHKGKTRYIEVLEMAIKALEQEPCEDAVSRKALISHIENQSRKWGEDYDAQQILGDIEDMPSVKPQEPCDVPDTNVGDIISKQTALDTITRVGLLKNETKLWQAISECLREVEKLPPVNSQEPKTVLYSGDGYADGYMVYDMAECPNCGYEYEDGDKDWGLSFCPNCGQKLNWERSDKE